MFRALSLAKQNLKYIRPFCSNSSLSIFKKQIIDDSRNDITLLNFYNTPQCQNLIKLYENHSVKPCYAATVLQNNISAISHLDWKKFILVAEYFFKLNFPIQLIETLLCNAFLLDIPIPTYETVINHFLSYKFSLKNIEAFLQSYPEIFLLPIDKMNDVINTLYRLFPSNHVNILINSNPRIWFDSSTDIELKFTYVYNDMGYDQKYILKSQLFQHPFIHIYTRHKFLVETGLFEKPDKKQPALIPKFPLRHILDTTDEDFISKTCSGLLTIHDLECFKYLIKNNSQSYSSINEPSIKESSHDLTTSKKIKKYVETDDNPNDFKEDQRLKNYLNKFNYR